MGAGRFASVVAVTLAATLSGCAHVVSGTATGSAGASADLGGYLLDAAEVAEIVGAGELSVITSSDELTDHSTLVSDPTCVGSVYPAEEQVYDGSGWTDVVHEVLAEPGGTTAYWVEQSVVRFGSGEQAQTFFDETIPAWSNCIGKLVVAEDEFNWRIKGVGIMGRTATQRFDDSGSVCDHTLSVTGEYAVEVLVCGMAAPDGQSVELASRVVDRIG
jgi:PknH-like extracellular domain